MPNQRAPGQKLLNFPAKAEFVDEIDRALTECGHSDRSKFIREAVYEKLEREGFKLPISISLAPGRKGKGGSPTHYPAHQPNAATMNEAKRGKPSRKIQEAKDAILQKAAAQAKGKSR